MFRILRPIVWAVLAFLAMGGTTTASSATPIPDRGEVVLQFPTDHSHKNESSMAWMDKAMEEWKARGGKVGDGNERRGLRFSLSVSDGNSLNYGDNNDRRLRGRDLQDESTEADPPTPVESGAVKALQVDKIRAKHPHLTGAGMKIGVISSSFNSKGGYETDFASGDLPADVVVLEDAPIPLQDDGRAMLQLIHDLVPDAKLYFHTSGLGDPFSLATAIERLADEGCHVIVDDVFSNLEPWFQEGIATQTANDVAELRGIPYFSSAGNSGRFSWEATYQGVDCEGYISCHDFGGGIASQRITVSDAVPLDVQWDDPWVFVSGPPGAATDIDVLLFDPVSGELVFAAELPNVGQIPLETVFVPPGTWDMALALVEGPEPTIVKWIISDDTVFVGSDPPTNSATLVGQANAPFVAGVGAAEERQLFSKLELEEFSSPGGVPYLFNRDGSRKAEPLVTNQPRFVGPDGTANTFFGPKFVDPRTNESTRRFYGTSASAPNVAAVALLMLQANPDLTASRVYDIMEQTAIDMNEDGFDFASGHGFVNGYAAVQLALAEGKGITDETKPRRWKRISRRADRATCDYTTLEQAVVMDAPEEVVEMSSLSLTNAQLEEEFGLRMAVSGDSSSDEDGSSDEDR